MNSKKISIVIPCFNEEENIKKTHQRLTSIISRITKKYEIIFIENGSIDSSAQILKGIVAKDTNVIVISLSRNFGIYGAYATGLSYATGDSVVIIDCDLQDPPELIPQMVKKWEEGYDVVYGIRSKRKGDFVRTNLVKLYYRVINKLSYIDVPIDAGDFSLLDKKVVKVINALPEHMRYLKGLRAWVGFKQIGIEYERQERLLGETKFSIVDYFRLAFQSIFSFSNKPLELIFYLAVTILILAILGSIVYFLLLLFSPNILSGSMLVILTIFFMGGIQLLSLSIIAQYQANIFEEVKNRPNFIVKEVLSKNYKKK